MFFNQEECFLNAELEPLCGNQWSEFSRRFIDSQMLQYLKKYNCSLFLFSCFFCGIIFLFVCLLGLWGFFPLPCL